MDPSELNLPQSLQPPSLVSEVVCSHHPMENPPQNQQYEKEQLETEQPELELNLTSGPLLTRSLPPQPTPPLRRLEQNLTPWPLPTGSLPPAAMSSPLGPLEQNLTPWPLPTRPLPPLPTPLRGPLELNLSTSQQQDIQFGDSAVGWLEQSQEEQVELGLNMTPSPLPPRPPPTQLPQPQPTWLDLFLQNYEPILGDKCEEVGVVGTGEVETELDKLNSGCLGHEKGKENTPGGESGNDKTIDVGIATPLGDVLQTEGMDLNEGFPQLNSDQVTAVTVDTNNVIEQENQNEDFGIGEVEVVEMFLKEQLEPEQEMEQPALDLNLTRGPLPTRPLPTSPLEPQEQNLTPWPLPARPLSPLPTPPQGPLELNLSTGQQQEIQFDDSAVACVDLHLELNLPQSPRPLPSRPLESDPAPLTREIQMWTRYLLGDEGETELDQLSSGRLGHERSKENTPGGESAGNKKTAGVGIASPLEGVSQTEGMDLNEGFSQLNSDPLASDQVAAVTVDTNNVTEEVVPLLQLSLTAEQENQDEDVGIDEVEEVEMCLKRTQNDGMSLKGAAMDLNASAVAIDANSVVAKDIPPPQFSATAQQDNPDEDFGNDELGEVEIYLERTESGRIAEPQFESRCFVKRKRTEKTPGEETRNKKTGVRIGTPSKDSLQTKGVSLKDDEKHLKGVKPTKFKRGARLRQRELKVHDMPSSKKQSKSVKGGTLRNTSRGGLAESNVDVNTVSGQASLKKWLMSFNRKGGIKIDKPCLTEITSENEGEVLERAFRSSLIGMMRLIKELNLRTCQKEVLKKTPFWGMFEAIIENKLSPMQCHQRGMMIIEIIKTYDPITRKFRIGRESMELTPADMASIFGISCGNERVSLKYGCKEDVKLVARREDVRLVESWLSSELLKQLLKKYVGSDEKDDVENVARLLCVYLCHAFFFATGPRVKWAYLKLVKDLDRMQDYDWNGAIINELMSSITTYHSEPWKVTGCVTTLLYWLCEHTNLFEANHSEHPLGIVRWKIPLVVSRLKEIRLKDLKPRQVVSRQANVARTADDQVPVDKDTVQDLVSLGDVPVSKRRNDSCLGNEKKDVKTPIGERVGRSALKRVRPHYNIHRSSPTDEHNLIGQERIPQSNSDPLLPPNQVNDTMKTNSVTVKARYGKETIKFHLSRPWRMVELKQQVKKRLELKAGTYCIRYKDENDELILIACDEDLQDCISNSSQLATSSIELFLELK